MKKDKHIDVHGEIPQLGCTWALCCGAAAGRFVRDRGDWARTLGAVVNRCGARQM